MQLVIPVKHYSIKHPFWSLNGLSFWGIPFTNGSVGSYFWMWSIILQQRHCNHCVESTDMYIQVNRERTTPTYHHIKVIHQVNIIRVKSVRSNVEELLRDGYVSTCFQLSKCSKIFRSKDQSFHYFWHKLFQTLLGKYIVHRCVPCLSTALAYTITNYY